ncbi:MAG: TonB-dependent receptor [Parvularculaceae bacterium]|nr:TonB-dependent receptor [Parvularculaceae bacterium]
MANNLKIQLFAGVAGMALASPAFAQGETSGAGAFGDDQDRDVIIVTSRFREESVQDIGVSVTGISGDELAEQGLRDIDDIARVVPGLQSIKTRQNSNDIAIRGIISSGSGRETNSVFSVFLDDVSVQGAGTLRDFSSFDLNRIEVIRGPQPTLFGEGAVGGVIRYFTVDPDLDGPTVTGVARGQFETIKDGGNAYSGENATSIILSPGKLGLRVSGFYRKDEGFIDNPAVGEDVNDFDTWGGRAVLLAQPTDELEIRLSAFIARDDVGESTQVDPGSDPKDLTLSISPYTGSFTDDFDLYSGRISYDFGALEVTSITGYYERKTEQALFSAGNSFGLAPFFPTVDTLSFDAGSEDFDQISQEFRFVSDLDGPLNFTSGFYFRDRDSAVARLLTCAACVAVTSPPSAELAAERNRSQSRQYSGFVELTFDMTDRLRLIGGVRYVNETLTANLEQNDVVALIPRFDGMGNLIPWTETDPIGFVNILDNLTLTGFGTEFEFKLDRFLPRGGVEYDVTDNVLFYTNAAVGARNGGVGTALSALGVSGGDPDVFFDNLLFDEDSVFSVDGGFKSEWRDGDITANLGLFYTRYNDTQIQVNTPVNNTINGPKQRIIGLEFESTYRVSDSLSTFFNAAAMDAEFTENQLISGAPAGAPATFFDLMKGNRPVNAPKFTMATGYSFSHPIGAGNLNLTSSGSFQYIGRRNSSVENYKSTELDPLTSLNLRLGIENDVWSLNVFATNLLNDIEEINIGANPIAQFIDSDGALDAPVVAANVNRPRSIGVNLTLRY